MKVAQACKVYPSCIHGQSQTARLVVDRTDGIRTTLYTRSEIALVKQPASNTIVLPAKGQETISQACSHDDQTACMPPLVRPKRHSIDVSSGPVILRAGKGILCYLPNASPIKQSCCSPVQDVLFAVQASRKNGKAVGTMMANVTLKATIPWAPYPCWHFVVSVYMQELAIEHMCAESF